MYTAFISAISFLSILAGSVLWPVTQAVDDQSVKLG